MRAGVCCVAALMGAMAMSADVAAVKNNSSMAPLMLVAQANTAQQSAAQRERVLGICDVVNLGQAELLPDLYTDYYFKMAGINTNLSDFFATAKFSIIQQPAHGSLEPDSRGNWRGEKYFPNDGYLGDDSFVVQVEGNGYKVKLHYFMYTTDMVGGVTNPNPVCKGEQGRSYWKISQDANGNSILTAVNYPSSFTGNTGSQWGQARYSFLNQADNRGQTTVSPKIK